MKRRVISVLVLTASFLMIPQYFHAEETGERKEARSSLLGNVISQSSELIGTTVQETTDVVDAVAEEVTTGTNELTEEIVNTAETTVINASEEVNEVANTLTKRSDNTATSTVLKETINVVKDAKKNTKSVVNKTTEIAKETIKATKKETVDVTKTITRTLEKIEDTTDEVLNELPPVPVVTPIVEELKEQLTNEIKPVVEKPIEQVVDKVGETIKKPIEQTMEKPVKQAESTPVQKSPNLEMVPERETKETIATPSLQENEVNPVRKEEVKLEKESETEIEIDTKDSFVATDTPIENTPLSNVKIKKLKSLSESQTLTERVNSSNDQAVEKTTKEKTSTESEKLKPVSQNQKKETRIFLTEPLENALTPSNPINSSYSSPSSGGTSDRVQGVLLLLLYQTDQVNNGWHYGNKFALKQWIYDPLGKPPKFAPFLID